MAAVGTGAASLARSLFRCSTDGMAVNLLDGNRATLRGDRMLSGSVRVARATIPAAINSWLVGRVACERLWERPQNNGMNPTKGAKEARLRRSHLHQCALRGLFRCSTDGTAVNLLDGNG